MLREDIRGVICPLDLPELHREVSVRSNATVTIRVHFGRGSTVTGRIVARTGNLGGRRIELINERGVPVSAATTKQDGSFRMTTIPQGTYRVKVHYANPWFNTEAVDVDGVKELDVTVDCDRRRLKR